MQNRGLNINVYYRGIHALFGNSPKNESIWTVLSHPFLSLCPPPVFLLLHAVFLVLQWKVGKLITQK